MKTPEPDTYIRRRFEALPPPQLPAALGARIDAARSRRISQRWGACITASGLLALAIALPLSPPVDVPAVAPAPSSRAPRATPAHPQGDMPLATLDLEIQRAYNRGAPDAEIAVLLSAREALARGSAAKALTPIRI